MSEFEDKLNSILSDPGEMEKISRLAAELLGGSGGDAAAPGQAPADGAMLGKLGQLFGASGASGGGGGDKTALIRALSPYLKPERQRKLLKALRLAQMARLAGRALEDYGGDKSV